MKRKTPTPDETGLCLIVDRPSEAQLHSKSCRRSIDVPIPQSIGRNHAWIAIDLSVIRTSSTPVVTRVAANLTAQLPQLMPPLLLISPRFSGRSQRTRCGSDQSSAKHCCADFFSHCVDPVERRHGFKERSFLFLGGCCPLDSFKITALLVKPAAKPWCSAQEVVVGFW